MSAIAAVALLFLCSCSHAPPVPSAVLSPTHDSGAVLQGLRDGNRRFVLGNPAHPRQGPFERVALSGKQSPKAVILSCSDSRVPPEVVFDQGLGDLFVVRVAGNIADPAGIASIEYAVEHFAPELLIVLGHDSCGAVQAAIKTPPGQSAGSPALDSLVSEIRGHLARRHALSKNTDPLLRAQVMANVQAVIDDLMARSKIIRERVRSGKLRVLPALYELESGQVDFWTLH